MRGTDAGGGRVAAGLIVAGTVLAATVRGAITSGIFRLNGKSSGVLATHCASWSQPVLWAQEVRALGAHPTLSKGLTRRPCCDAAALAATFAS